jgi:hypothetical protein
MDTVVRLKQVIYWPNLVTRRRTWRRRRRRRRRRIESDDDHDHDEDYGMSVTNFNQL